MKAMLINNWSTMNAPCSPYVAPECRPSGFVLHGQVKIHRVLGECNSRNIVTSSIKTVVGRLVFTKSGSCYKLGTANKEWVAYLIKECGYGWIENDIDVVDNPIPDTFLKKIGLK